MNWSDLNIVIPHGRTSGKVKTICPHCHDQRSNKRDKSLSVNLDEGLYHCHYCDWAGTIKEHTMKKEYFRPKWNNNTTLSDKVIKYFESRMIPQAIVKDMKITEGLEWMPQENKKMNTIQFNYFLNGELVNVKYRTGNKYFKLIPNAELVPYNLNAIKGAKECVITEGEFDALSFIACGYKMAVSVPNGASANTSYLDYYMDYFEDKETIYIAADTDNKGLILREELIRRFGPERCKIVTYGEECKDANECLCKRGAAALLDTLKNAQDIKIDGIFTVNDFENELDALFEKGLQKGLTIGHPNFDELCSFETKRLCVVTGVPGSGKSEFLDEIAERINILYGWKFAYFSPENFPLQLHASKIVSKITGQQFDKKKLPINEYRQVKQYMSENFFFICPDTDYTISTILEKAQFLVKSRGIKALVIDPWNRLEHQQPPGMSETNYISKALDQLSNFAQRNDILIFLMAHPTKMNKSSNGVWEVPTLYNISGSANFYNKADYGITVHRDKEAGNVGVYVQKVKFRHLGSTGVATFKFNLFNGRYNPLIDGKPAEWDNSNHLIKKLTADTAEASKAELPFANSEDSCPF